MGVMQYHSCTTLYSCLGSCGSKCLSEISILIMLLSGEEIVAGDDIYGGSDRLLSQVTPKNGVVVKLVPSFHFP